jgi:hypothetical protein
MSAEVILLCGTPAGVRSLNTQNRWCRPLRAQPPARVPASLRLANADRNSKKSYSSMFTKVEEKV